MYQKNFDFIVEKARAAAKPVRVAIAGADVENILLGAFQAEADGFAKLILLGDQAKITTMLKDLSLFTRDYTIVNIPEDQDVVQAAIDMVKDGKADVLMRGNTQTREFLMPILDSKNGLIEKGHLLSHVTMLKVPEYRRLLAVTDVTVMVNPSVEQRKKIVANVASVLNAMGYERPNIALLSLIEKPAFHMRDTTESQTIVRQHNEHEIANCNLAGPIAYDLVISKEAARLKGYDCPYCGEFDAIVTPNLLAGNLLVKAMQIHGHASSCGILVGANLPIAITSRSDPAEQAYLSLAVCAGIPVESVKANLK